MPEISLPITTLSASLLSLLLIVLSVAVIRARQTTGVSLGGGDDTHLQRRIRAQANLVEYAPFFLILCGLAEIQGASTFVLTALAVIFVLGRVAHGYALAFTDGNVACRLGGTVATFLGLGLAALITLILGLT